MKNEKYIWILERSAERLWNVASNLAAEAARAGLQGRGFAIVAEETRQTAEKLSDMVMECRFGSKELNRAVLDDICKSLSYLALNAAIEAYRSEWMGKGVAVCAEDIRWLALEIVETAGGGKPDFAALPRAASPLLSTKLSDCFLQFSFAGFKMVENLAFVQEVFYGLPSGKTLRLRGTELPVADLHGILGEEKPAGIQDYVIVRTGWTANPELIAVPVNKLDINAIFASPVGRPVQVDSNDAMSGYIRECWENDLGGLIRFMSWEKISPED